jgi:hypothetical protein
VQNRDAQKDAHTMRRKLLTSLFPRAPARHKRCASCGGRFGLIRQRWFATQFCSKRCRDKFLAEAAEHRNRLRWWLGYLKTG